MVATAFDPAEVNHTRRDAAALERFYLAYYDDVVRYLVRRLHDPHDVADLVADTFLAAVDAAGSYDHRRGGPLPWLIGIAHNKLRRWYRRQYADRDLAHRAVGRRLLDDDDDDLVDLQGFTPAEAARVLGVSAGVARIRLHRVRKALRNTLEPDPGPLDRRSGKGQERK